MRGEAKDLPPDVTINENSADIKGDFFLISEIRGVAVHHSSDAVRTIIGFVFSCIVAAVLIVATVSAYSYLYLPTLDQQFARLNETAHGALVRQVGTWLLVLGMGGILIWGLSFLRRTSRRNLRASAALEILFTDGSSKVFAGFEANDAERIREAIESAMGNGA